MHTGAIIEMETVRGFWEWLTFDMRGGVITAMEAVLGLWNG